MLSTNPPPSLDQATTGCTPKMQHYNPQATKRVLNMKSKRKQNLVKKAHELAKLANLQISIVIFD